MPTMVSKPYYRLDVFNSEMRDVLFTSVLVTIHESHTLGHFGTSNGRILQVGRGFSPSLSALSYFKF